jgi:hypothetical protein
MEKKMKKRLFYISMLAIAVLAGCGQAPAPTMSPGDIQGTAVAAAWTVVAMTEMSIPTATPLPPTEIPSPTPLPTFTPLPPPTSSIGFPTQVVNSFPTSIPAAGGGPTADACSKPIDPNAGGHTVKTNIQNQSGGNVVLSLYLAKTSFGECGYYSFSIPAGSSVSANLLAGCYWAGAFVTGKKDTKSFGVNTCIKGPTARIVVNADFIRAQ